MLRRSAFALGIIPLLISATFSQQQHNHHYHYPGRHQKQQQQSQQQHEHQHQQQHPKDPHQQHPKPRRQLQYDQPEREPLWVSECSRFSTFDTGISEELLYWQETGITEQLMAAAIGNLSINRGSTRTVALSVAILQGKLYVPAQSTINMTTWWFAHNLVVWVHALKRITERWGPSVPDVEILLAADDEATQDTANQQLWSEGTYWPVMRHCKSTQSADITIPIWHFYTFNASARFFHRTEHFSLEYPWEAKQQVAFGAGVIYHRDMSLAANARFFDDPASTSGKDWGIMLREKFAAYLREELRNPNIVFEPDSPIETWGRYKMVIHLDGITCSSKIWQLLALGSVVLKEQSNYASFFDKYIHSFMHYVPFWRHRPHEVQWAYDWVTANDDAARRISRAGQAFVREWLNMQGLECYWLLLLRRYAALQRFQPGAGPRSVASGYYVPADQWLAAQDKIGLYRRPPGYCANAGHILELLPQIDLYAARMGSSGVGTA